MKRWIISAGLAVAIAALAAPALANHKHGEGYWWPNSGHSNWSQDWDDDDWDDNDWDDDWRGDRGLVPPEFIVQDLRHKGFRDIKEVQLDDDGDVYKVRARNPDGEYVRLFFNAHNGRFLERQFID